MKLTNHEIAEQLRKIADTLEINGDNPYRIRAYRRAARSVESFQDHLVDLEMKGFDLTLLPFVGKGIAAHIKEIISNDQQPIRLTRRVENKYVHNRLKRIAGLGPKRIKQLNEVNIYNKEQLLAAIQQGKLKILKGFSQKLQNKILDSLKNPRPYEKFFKYRLASMILTSFRNHLLALNSVKEVYFGGSIRRKKEIIGNSEIIVITNNPTLAIEQSLSLLEVEEVIKVEKSIATVILRSGMFVKIIAMTSSLKGAGLLYYTGSKSHLEGLNEVAKKKNFQLKPTGLFFKQKCIARSSEKAIYNKLELEYIEPELRENKGELLAAKEGKLPHLIKQADIKGDLHTHTNETDGTEDLEVMVQAASQMGYEYIAITDHSQGLAITHGLDEKRLLKQIKLIDTLNSKLKHIRILKSIEVDILEDGRLDLPDYILKELDLRVCSVHSKFNLSESKQTERIIRAMDNPLFNILGHATGRIINYRQPYPLDIGRILEAAKSRHCFVELNAQPSRLDLKDEYCRMAKEMGVKLTISSDAHSIIELSYIKYGIDQARRGWLEPSDVINTYPLAKLIKSLKR